MQFMNVKEKWFLYDTILISKWIDTLPFPINGWYNSFATLGASDFLSFFTTRNKSIGLAYNNQESRDQIPFALVAETLSVEFFAPSVANQKYLAVESQDLSVDMRTDVISPFWETEVPQHASVIFRTNQDERLRTNAAMVPPGHGPIGHMRGQGALNAPVPFPPTQHPDLPITGGESGSINAGGQGRAHLKYRWMFEEGGIGIQKRATIEVEVRFTEWLRSILQNIWGPGRMKFWPWAAETTPYIPAETPGFYASAYGIRVLLTGRRQVQQRGEYHV